MMTMIHSRKKKAFSLVLALLMLISTAAPAFADVFAFVTVEEPLVYTDGELSASMNGYSVKIRYGPDAEIPEGAAIQLYEIPEGTLQYDGYLDAAEDSLTEDEQTVFARFFDITLTNEAGEKIEPAAPVDVEISADEVGTAERVTVVHFPDDAAEPEGDFVEEAIEKAFGENALRADRSALKAEFPAEGIGRAELTVEDNALVFDGDLPVEEASDVPEMEVVDSEKYEGIVAFRADGFSVYGIVGTETIKTEYVDGKGNRFDVTVEIPSEAKIPTAESVVIKEYTGEDAEYIDAYNQIVEKESQSEEFNRFAFSVSVFDLSIVDDNGDILEPEVPVHVTIEMKEYPEGATDDSLKENLKVEHFNARTGEIKLETIENRDITVEGDSVTVQFEVDGFSTFALTWGTNGEQSATIHFGKMEGESFVEFEQETISFDTSASSISIANSFEGYTYLDAVYCATGLPREQGVDIDSILYKTDNGWAMTQYITNENEEIVETRVPIANNSDIYVTYFVPEGPNPSGSNDDSIPSPSTTKKVTSNGDGTYTITLDITGATVTEDNSHYANILVILDATRSMNGAKWTNAKAAMKALIETLVEGENASNAGKIDFALVTFGRSATVEQTWTKDNAAFKNTCAGLSMVSTSGTNWEAGMRGGLYGVLNTYPQGETAENHDPTYVIFLTDGDPNVYYQSGSATNYTNTGTTSGYSQNAQTSADHSKDEAKEIAAIGKLYGIYCGDTGTTPSGASFNRLVSVISADGQGGIKTIAANASTIESEFKAIAETMLKEMGANNVSADDGVPSLSSVSAQTVGEASGFEYYIAENKENPQDTDFTTWAGAPGASYSNDNGVTWDLSAIGTLPEKTTYRLKFTVWPSQEAYDLIADLNNGVKTMSDDDLEKAGIEKNSNGVYTLKTNTHLKTNYTFNGETYTDNNALVKDDMVLPTEPITIKKIWNNPYDPDVHNPGAGVDLFVTKDEQLYLFDDNAVHVTAVGADGEMDTEDDWIATKPVYISCGFISQAEGSAAYQVKEDGHDYSIAEPASFSYLWDLTSPVYHPMVFNGSVEQTKILILDDQNNGTEGIDYYLIKGADGAKHKYRVATSGESVLTAYNDRRSFLNLYKEINDLSDDLGADPDALFEWTCTFGEAGDEDIYFSAYSGGFLEIEGSGITKEIKDGSWTGYYYAPAGSPFKINIKAGWSIRFINVHVGTEYTIEETNMDSGFTFEKVYLEEAWNYQTSETEEYTVTVEGSAASGTIEESNHGYYFTFVNKYEPSGVTLVVNKVWDTGTPAFVTTHGPITVALFRDANGDGSITSDEYISGSERTLESGTTSVTYNKLSSLAGVVIREVTITTETTGEGDEAVETKTVTPINPNGYIAVGGETTTLGDDNATNTYLVTYVTPGTISENSRTDTVTNTMPKLIVTKTDDDNDHSPLADAVFKLTDLQGNVIGNLSEIVTDANIGNVLNNFYLSNGVYYLEEINAPTGYIRLTHKIKITVAEPTGEETNVINAIGEPGPTNYQVDPSEDGLTYSFSILNNSGALLPSTGSANTIAFTIAGLTMVGAVGAVLHFRKKDEE